MPLGGLKHTLDPSDIRHQGMYLWGKSLPNEREPDALVLIAFVF